MEFWFGGWGVVGHLIALEVWVATLGVGLPELVGTLPSSVFSVPNVTTTYLSRTVSVAISYFHYVIQMYQVVKQYAADRMIIKFCYSLFRIGLATILVQLHALTGVK